MPVSAFKRGPAEPSADAFNVDFHVWAGPEPRHFSKEAHSATCCISIALVVILPY